jgi:rod shape-determining protein MreD
MSTRKISLTAILFLIIYIVQEAFVTQLQIAGGGFSLFLIFALLWAALSSPNVGALTGFVAGFLIDLSQSTMDTRSCPCWFRNFILGAGL